MSDESLLQPQKQLQHRCLHRAGSWLSSQIRSEPEGALSTELHGIVTLLLMSPLCT